MASGESNSSAGDVEYQELWRSCAGPLLHLPRCGERVFYFPQGHLEQVAASSNQRLDETLPATFDLPSRILCCVVNIDLRASEGTDEVYAQIALVPELCQTDVTKPDRVCPDTPNPIVKSFRKVLTATDTSTKLHVRQHDAHTCFPPLDMTLENPSQQLIVKDLHGISWNFKHVFGGKPKRHLLSTGWKSFVTAKRLVSGDSVIFIRGENGEIRVGTRRVFGQRRYAPPHCYLASDKRPGPQVEVLATAHHALCSRSLFIVFYRPGPGISPFIVGLNRSVECATKLCSIGMKFSMRFEREDHLLGRCTGSIVEVGDFSPHWKDSQWRCLKVKWDESATSNMPERISPWEIDPVDVNEEQRHAQSNGRLGERNQAKKSRQPRNHSSAREKKQTMDMSSHQLQMHNMSQMVCAQQMCSNEDNLFQLMCSNQLQSNISMGPLYSNEDNWFHSMLHQQGSAKDDGPGNGMNTIICGQFPTESPPIHFSQLDGSPGTTIPPCRVSINSEESVKGETRKRKASSIEDAESGNGKEVGCDDRQVKSRVQVSNSDETHYSSASEGEPSTSNLTPVGTTANVIDRPILYSAMDRIFGFLHQLKNYVAK